MKRFESTKGYKLIKNVVKKKESEALFGSFLKVVNFCTKKNKNFFDWKDQALHDYLIELRINNKKKFSLIYDVMQKNNALNEFCFNLHLKSLAAKFLNVDSDELMMTSQLRLDVPEDDRNIYDWHQDSAYDKLNRVPSNGAVVWIPLLGANIHDGTLFLKPYSQKEPNVYIKKKEWSKYISPQLTVPNQYLKKYETIQIPVKKNSALVMYPNLFHKSGNNISKKIRITVLARFNKILTKDFYLYN
jgi:ectoine hydroxylase-related dioxygenase (phytanoyl-CoA dioxygenase family)